MGGEKRVLKNVNLYLRRISIFVKTKTVCWIITGMLLVALQIGLGVYLIVFA